MDNAVLFYGFATATIFSFGLLVVALITKKGIYAYIAVPLSIPCSLYLAGAFYLPAFCPLLIGAGGYLINRNSTAKAALCFAPYLILSGTIILFGYVLDAW